jgi:hypothetical protein
VLYAAPRSTNTLTGVLGVAAALSDSATAAHRHRRGLTSTHRRSARVAVLAGVGALAGNVLGRTGARTCHPESRWQGHAAWHALGAVAAAAYATVVVDRTTP